jgi:hypothetical protein
MAVMIPNYRTGPRGIQKAVTEALRDGWYQAALYFHLTLREKRFTAEHARKAGYAPRKGQDKGQGSKSFWKSYTGRKMKKFGHTRPLEFTGRTRKAMATANISATTKGATIRYPGARVFNYRNPLSDPAMNLNLEFRTILPEEADAMAKIINDNMYTINESTDTEVLDLLGF